MKTALRRRRPSHSGSHDAVSPVNRLRVLSIIFMFAVIYVGIGARLVELALGPGQKPLHTASVKKSHVSFRPNIVDRHGRLMASDVKMQSLIADPKKILDVDDAVEKIRTVFPDLKLAELRRSLSTRSSRFAWVKRGVSPEEATTVHDFGLPGFRFIEEPRRVYPAGETASHILGYVDVDNRGRAGIEAYIDKIQGVYFTKLSDKKEKPPLRLSVDLGIQHIVREALAQAIKRYDADAGAVILLDIKSGEVIASVSLPDYDPNHRTEALEKGRFDRLTNGTFELGSIFKPFTIAMALDSGNVNLDDQIDASEPLTAGKFKIRDYHAQNRPLTVSEIFTYSSNIGSAKLANRVGAEAHKNFLYQLGLLRPMKTELGPVRSAQSPKQWRRVRSMTISYGHGISVAPLQFAATAAALFNGGYEVPITFLKRTRPVTFGPSARVIKSETSKIMRKLMRRNVLRGTGKNADAKGFRVGGKTGTAEKVVNGTYDKMRLLNSFLAIFPTEAPEYLMLTLIDEPKPSKEFPGERPTAGLTAAPLTGDIISQIAPILGILPSVETSSKFDERPQASY